MESVCHGDMGILLYVKLIWCSGFPEIYAQIEGGGGVSLPWVYVQSSTCETYLQCSGFPVDLWSQSEEGGGVSLPLIYVHSSNM